MRVGLVLGAGGVLGGAWLTGGLEALARETGWDPGSAEFIVGTSAGSMIGALCAAGVPPWFMVAHSRRRDLRRAGGRDGRPAAAGRPRGRARSTGCIAACPPIGPGSLRMAVSSARQARTGTRRCQVVAGWLPAGLVSTDAAQGHGPARRASALGRPPELLGRGLRLRDGPPRRRSAATDVPARRARRRRGGVLRDPRLLPPGDDRRPSLRGRRASARPRTSTCCRPRARPRDLPQPALQPQTPMRAWNPLERSAEPRDAAARSAAGWGSEAQQGARFGHRGGADRADRGGPRGRWART